MTPSTALEPARPVAEMSRFAPHMIVGYAVATVLWTPLTAFILRGLFRIAHRFFPGVPVPSMTIMLVSAVALVFAGYLLKAQGTLGPNGYFDRVVLNKTTPLGQKLKRMFTSPAGLGLMIVYAVVAGLVGFFVLRG